MLQHQMSFIRIFTMQSCTLLCQWSGTLPPAAFGSMPVSKLAMMVCIEFNPLSWGPILVRTRPQWGGGGSMEPKMVTRNNVLCWRQRRRRFCFRHLVRGEALFSHVFMPKMLRFFKGNQKRTKCPYFCWGPPAWEQDKRNNFASHFFFVLPRCGVAPRVGNGDRFLRDSGLGAWRQRRPLFLVYASFSSNHQCF